MRKILSKVLELAVLFFLYYEAKANEKKRRKRDAEISKAKENPSQAFKDKFNYGNDSGLWSPRMPTDDAEDDNLPADTTKPSEHGSE